MKAVVVYESLWGNTEAIAKAIAEGLGPGVRALSTAEAVGEAIAGAELIVAGAPVLGFKLPTQKMLDSIRADKKAPPADLSQPLLSSWLEGLPVGRGRGAAFDTQIRGPFGKAAPDISRRLEEKGYRALGKPTGFVVTGTYGPLKDGELERARAWGAELVSMFE
jgi:flavodoxin